MDIAAWLRELGLERYEQAFLDNEIDARVLPTLTAADLEDLGVTLVGHRRRLLNAIAALNDEAEPASEAEVAAPVPAEPVPSAERRQLTVLFCDLVGSTELASRLDPEDMGALVRAYHAACKDVVGRWDGHIAKYMGDGVLAYFGYPHAHEDDAERAVRAGLELTAVIEGLNTEDHASLAVRIGIATGLVMVGELIGEGAAKEQTVVGETPNLAARLQALAEPGTAVVAASTRRLLGGLFELDDLGPQTLKGFAEPVRAFRVAKESETESRFEALHGRYLLPLVGREHELGLLLERWHRAKDGEGQVVLLSGEPGIGKSRLVRAVRERLEGEPYTPLGHYCSPFHANSALYPVIGLLERAAGFARDDGEDERLAKLEALLGRGTDQPDQAVTLVASLLGVPTDKKYPPLELTPQRQRQRTLEVLADQVEGLARRQPVLVTYEDAHWADPTTLELLGLVIERAQRLPVLVLITFRPEFDPPWTGHPHVTRLSLSRLTRRHGGALIERVAGGKALPDALLAQIVAKTDGVPLFVEELTKSVLESGLLRDAGDRYELTDPLPSLAIPSSLHDSLMARLDRLAPVKEVAQVGAVIGREFSYELLAAVADRPEAELTSALDRLVSSELVFRRGTPPEATYSFKHALVQDAAYQSLLRSRRQALHAAVAAAIEQKQPIKAEQEPELLAHHLTQAGAAERAITYWRAAAQRASERSAHQEALTHLGKSVELLRELPENEKRDRLELEVQINLGSAFIVIHGYSVAGANDAYERARELAHKLDEQAQLFTATWGLWMVNQTRMHVEAGRALADELLDVAEHGVEPGRRLQAHHAAWTTLLFVPDLAACRRHTEQGLALYDPDQHAAHKFRYGGHDPGVCGLVHRGLSEWLLGFPDQALDRVREALSLARHLGHGPSLSIALNMNSYLHRFRRETAAALERSEELIRLCAEQGISPQLAAWARVGRGWAMAQAGDLEPGLAEMREGVGELEAVKMRFRRAYQMAALAEICIKAGRVQDGERALSSALEGAERWWEPEVHRLRGDLALAEAAGASREAEQHFQRALSVARAQQSRSLELRTATSLARLWAERGERHKAHDLLAPVYGWFTEGFDTADLKDAKALLDGLR